MAHDDDDNDGIIFICLQGHCSVHVFFCTVLVIKLLEGEESQGMYCFIPDFQLY